jgi:hypothetical protein
MTTAIDPDSDPAPGLPRIVISVALALCAMNAVSLVVSALSGQWILDHRGLGNPTDFTNVYAAGRLALEGHPALAYDWDAHKHVQTLVLGRDFDGYFGWHYPPPFLFVAALLAKLPYTAAFAGWVVLTFIPYLVVVRALVGHRIGWLLACAFPEVLTNAMIGQNGLLTAALIGGTLLWMRKRPVVAGICLGLLTYKPQYGLLFPLVLIATRQWTAFVSATVTALLLAAASTLAFGSETWLAFVHWLPRASEAFLSAGYAEFGKMQSVLSLVRFAGGSDGLAFALQWSVAGATAIAVVILWRGRAAYEIKAAALATGALLATPYLYLYDLAVLAVPMALLLRVGMATGFRRYELPALGCAILLLVSFPFVVAPVGLAATMLVAAVIAGRCGVFGAPQADAPALPMPNA